MNIKIETLSIRHLGEIYRLEKQCFEHEAFTKQQLEYLLIDYNTIGLAARENSEIVGFMIAQVDFGRKERFGHILTVDVAPACRRMGIAQKLLHEIEVLLRDRGVKECRLEVREDNFAAVSLYRELGYEEAGRLEKYYGNTDGLYLRKIFQ